MTDEQLMTHYQQGDDKAFQQLFEKYRDRIFRFIYAGFENDLSLVEEYTQEVFIKVIRSRNTYNPEKRFVAWLFTIARNHCLNKFARSSRRYEIISFELNENDAASGAGTMALENREINELIQEKVAELPEIQRTIFIMREVEEMSHKTIAQALSLSENNIRTQYHRAKNKLQTLLTPYLEGQK